MLNPMPAVMASLSGALAFVGARAAAEVTRAFVVVTASAQSGGVCT
jgi:hypothetical protein